MSRGRRGAERGDLAILGFTKFGVGEEMEEALALFGRRVLGHNFAASVTDELQPLGNAIVQGLLDFLPKPLGHGGAFAGSRDGNLEIAAADDSGEIKVAVRRIVHRIAEDAQTLGFDKYGAIDQSIGRGGDGQERAGKISELKFAGQPAELSSSSELLYFGIRVGCDNRDAGA